MPLTPLFGAYHKWQCMSCSYIECLGLQGSAISQDPLTSAAPLIQLGSQPIEAPFGTGENATLRRAFTTASMILQQSQDAPGHSH